MAPSDDLIVRPAGDGIGTKLRTVRLDRSLSLEETAWRTRIRPELLRALEADEFDQIGHSAFVRSHLSSYARFLGIDPAEIVDEFEARTEPAPSALEELDRRRRTSRKPPRAKWLVAAILSGAVLTAAAVAGVIGGQAERPVADVPTMASIPDDGGAVPAVLARVTVVIEATEDTHVTITVDGEEFFEGIIAAGDSRTFRARDRIEVFAANGGTVMLSVNSAEPTIAGPDGAAYLERFGPRGRLDAE